jgi:hypothetical protein
MAATNPPGPAEASVPPTPGELGMQIAAWL